MQGISNVDMSLSLFGERISMPICMAPVSLQAMANTLAETASAQGIKLNKNLHVNWHNGCEVLYFCP